MAKRPLPTPEELRQLIEYDPETGLLFWKARTADMFDAKRWGNQRACKIWNSKFAGTEALRSNSSGYKHGMVKRTWVRAHSAAWAIYYGLWPTDQIDHINGNRTDNRIDNLRDVTNAENGKNQKQRVTNSSGVTGVSWCERRMRWQAYITVKQKRFPLGRFENFFEAVMTRKAAEKKHGFHPNHGRNQC